MTDGEQETRREFLAHVVPWADAFSKAIAGIAIALYASGFLIVSIYHSKFGFVGTNPFRPRVLAAGAWFFFLAGIPLSIAARYRTYSWREFASESAALWVICLGLSLPMGYIIFDVAPVSAISMRTWLSFLLFGLFIALLAARKYKKAPTWLVTAASCLLTVFYIFDPFRRFFGSDEFDVSSVALWFFFCIAITFTEITIRGKEDLTENAGWSKPLVAIFAVLLLFATRVYPHLRASWGGGTPVPVTVYLTKDSLLNPNKAVQARLVDESDEGFYIVGPKESKAIFIPRNAVALIYFSDQTADSGMLKNIK